MRYFVAYFHSIVPDITALVYRDSLKIVILSSWAFVYMTFTVYSGSIISSLLAKQDAIQGYEDLHTFGFTIVSDPQAFHSYIFTDVSLKYKSLNYH